MASPVVNTCRLKSGTTTSARALKVAGYPVADHRIRPKQMQQKALHDKLVATLLGHGYFETGDPRHLEVGVADARAQSIIAAHIGCDLPWRGRANSNHRSTR